MIAASAFAFALVASAPSTDLPSGSSSAVLPLVIDAKKAGTKISPNLFGIFFEEINHAGDGGLYPELVRNRAFHATDAGVTDWTTSPRIQWTLGNGRGIAQLPAQGYLENPGYWGISLDQGKKYKITLQGDGQTTGDETQATAFWVVVFQGNDVKVHKLVKFGYSAGPRNNRWSTKSLTFTASSTVRNGRLVIKAVKPGSLVYASILPQSTFKKSGLRTDLASAVNALKPAFVRFPGGCYVEGGDLLANRFQWKTTVRPDENRPGHFNAIWGYWSTDGLGYHEYLQWCEDMHAEPLFVFNCGLSHKEQVPLSKLHPYLQDALDAIEYANGPVTSKWGALRAKRGHPKPFGLRYVEIGNENGLWSGFGGTRQQYEERYLPIYKAIKAKYPYIRTVADTRVSAPMDIVDDHYYNSPAWFWQNVGLYDKAPRNGPKVYVGEYAVTSDCGLGNLKAALAEAAFMTGLERNGDVVELASYAPLFVRKENRAWNPDAIVFDGSNWYGTPSYWVQRLFAENHVTRVVPVSVPKIVVPPTAGGVGVGSWGTKAEYKDIQVTTASGETLTESTLKPYSGKWTLSGGDATQTTLDEGAIALAKDPRLIGELNYTVSLKARKIEGAEGFLILLRARDQHNFLWWNIGGWGNTSVAVEKESAGGRAVISGRKGFQVQSNRWYDIKIEVNGSQLKLFVDGLLIQTAQDSGVPRLAADAGFDPVSHDLVVKVVNGDAADHVFDLVVPNQWKGVAHIQTLRARTDPGNIDLLMDMENTFDAPEKIGIFPSKASVVKGHIKLLAPRGSVSVVRIPAK